MPDILIRGMEMPTGCASCDFAIYKADSAYHYCFWLKQVFVKPDARLKSCPLHELPPHGDLIDRDALLSRGKNNPFVDSEIYHPCVQTNCREIVMDEPVVVPAEREGE